MPVTTVMMRGGGLSGTSKALEEAARAKVTTGGRSKTLASIELQMAKAKYMVRSLQYKTGRKTVRVD
jgi:hypothetical protein